MERSLKKELTLLDIFCVATGAMISLGLFISWLAFGKAALSGVLFRALPISLCSKWLGDL